MTLTKRKRVHAEQRPVPGDLVTLSPACAVLRNPGDYDDRIRWVMGKEVALLLAVCDPINRDFLDWSLVFTLETNALGWVRTDGVKPCP